ncbi:MAG TPA: hypothetical protein VF348_11625 [Usitatibacter sp.]
MLDDVRSHDPRPDETELAWMRTDPLRAAARVLVLVALAVSVGTAASQILGTQAQSGAVVAKAR